MITNHSLLLRLGRCGYDTRLVWTSTKCGSESDSAGKTHHAFAQGRSEDDPINTGTVDATIVDESSFCTDDDVVQNVARCCADSAIKIMAAKAVANRI